MQRATLYARCHHAPLVAWNPSGIRVAQPPHSVPHPLTLTVTVQNA
jgi:hypothetical protein